MLNSKINYLDDEFSICSMTEADCAGLSRLCGQLGFEGNPDEIFNRYQDLKAHKNHQVNVVMKKSDQRIVGMIHFYGALSFLSEKTVELGALVIDHDYRNRGLGRLLVDSAQKWAIEQGYQSLLLATQIHRSEAIRFYHRQNFKTELTTYFLRKDIFDS